MSNIFIGFQDSIKISRGHKRTARIKFSSFSFEHLAFILERDRIISVRRLAGSIRHAHQMVNKPQHFVDADACGYDCRIFNQVEKIDNSNSARGKPQMNNGAAMYWNPTSGDESSDGPTSSPVLCPRTKYGEQGVDENLHLGMSQSLLADKSPGIMVLATGDAQPAEFSDGFAFHAIMALERGWKIEVVSWRRCLSGEWTKSPFKDKYKDRFRIILLDGFLEEIHASWSIDSSVLAGGT
jgi:hypothetical protein